MEFETISYPITSSQRVTGETEQHKSIEDNFIITIKFSDNKNEASIILTGEQIRTLSNRINYPVVKENYYLIAINNLLKKSDFLQLSLQFAENGITEKDFETELETNSDKYLIDLHENHEQTDVNVISEIVEKLHRDFTVDEISEIFSITPHCLNYRLRNK